MTHSSHSSAALAPLACAPVYQSVDHQVTELTRRYQVHMQCQAGCSHCCLSGFKVTYIEALNVFQALLVMPPDALSRILDQLQDTSRMACPLLDSDNRCAVYAVRPILCRAFGLAVQVDEQIGTCELNFTAFPEKETITTIGLRGYYDLLDELSDTAWQEHPLDIEESDVDTDEPTAQNAPRLTLQRWLLEFLQQSQQVVV